MKSQSFSLILAAGAISLVTAAPVAASEASEKFARMDANSDGQVTLVEHARFAEKTFAECDTNADGLLSPQESNASRADHGGVVHQEATDAHVRLVDRNGDGKISKIENEQDAREKFKQADANQDGVLTVDELQAAQIATNPVKD